MNNESKRDSNKGNNNEVLLEQTEKLKTIFSARTKEAREKNSHLTQAKVAEKIGTNDSHISKIENGLQLPNLATAVGIAKAINVSLNWLCGIDEYGNDEKEEDIWNKVSVAQAFLIVLNKFTPHVEVTGEEGCEEITLKLSMNGLLPSDKTTLANFFKGYLPIQLLMQSGLDCSDTVDELAEKLLKEYEDKI